MEPGDPVSEVGANTAELRIIDGTYEILEQYCGGRWGRLEIKQVGAGLHIWHLLCAGTF